MKLLKLSNPQGEQLHISPASTDALLFLTAALSSHGVKVDLIDVRPTAPSRPGFFGRQIGRQTQADIRRTDPPFPTHERTPLGELLDACVGAEVGSALIPKDGRR